MNSKKKEKQKKVQEFKIPEQDKEKMSVIKTDKLMKIGRIILWTVILFLLLRGIMSIIAPGSEQRLEQIVTDYQADAKLRETVQIGAAAFAEDFAKEYYTFSGKMNSDYGKRTSKYLAQNLNIKEPAAGQVQTTVEAARATKIHYITTSQLDVDLHLVVAYLPLTENAEQTRKDIYIRVPVSRDKVGEYAVTSTPLYISHIQAGNIPVEVGYLGEQVATKDVQSIKETLNSFFTVYYSGSDTEISYYLAGKSNIASGVGGAVEYSKIEYITAYKETETGDILVDTTITILDNLQPMQQRLFLRLQYIKGRYYIKNINTRAV